MWRLINLWQTFQKLITHFVELIINASQQIFLTFFGWHRVFIGHLQTGLLHLLNIGFTGLRQGVFFIGCQGSTALLIKSFA
ncbi:hypothetical protein RU080_08630 [Shewanella algae]|uniref:hypothetical protein n=1 Tax=Shewanella algae TaxID=38313 RepID=UPI0029361C80|nr:hypothetical protein [Shewanella algae]MDV2961792.1 hypothetical protein [Shewanella algae]